ncbi:Rieske 2Fe-2S domain-containing protein [Streptomyces sp. NPDC002659]|uniref:aromatic ring-hydroxylating oxygenase subunit alpha n=1 Tax=Streptomyces sp. NPDC002659 TaxID=3364656 RepID=UPI003678D9B2
MEYRTLIEPDRIHGSLYTNAEVFSHELARIWYREWVFVAHESELPESGDYVTRNVGRQPVVITRGEEGVIRVLLNRCSHRANLLCQDEKGSSHSFRCPYHGWTFTNSGELVGVPFRNGYGKTPIREKLALSRAPRVGSYKGFIFASLSPSGPALMEHLGNAAEAIDRLVDLSPDGEVELTAGWLKHKVSANWKMAVENQVDGYHPRFVHDSLFSAAKYQVRELCTDSSSALVRDHGNGHTELDFRPEYRKEGTSFIWFGRASEAKFPEYVERMVRRYGAERSRQLLMDGPPHVMIFPNLFLAEMNLLVIEPIGPSLTVQRQTSVLLKGAPEINRRAMRQTEGAMGPGGLLIPDDCEMMERNQVGLTAMSPEWLTLSRGMHREYSDEDGSLASNVTDETAQRGIWKKYLETMTEE